VACVTGIVCVGSTGVRACSDAGTGAGSGAMIGAGVGVTASQVPDMELDLEL